MSASRPAMSSGRASRMALQSSSANTDRVSSGSAGVAALARGEAQPLPAVVAEPAEAELVMAAAAKERPREPAEDHPTARVLRREPAEPAVEDERGVVRAEATPVRFRWDEHVGRHVHA